MDVKEGSMSSASKASSSCPSNSHHRRSKSASERNLDPSRHGNPHSMAKHFPASASQDPNGFKTFHERQGSCNQKPSNQSPSNATRNSRASLEDDIKQLQMHLLQEKSTRLLLERAIGRASSTLSPGHRHFSVQTKELISEIELLEEEISNREQHVLSLYRSIFDQCVSQPTSAHSSGMTSPAHSSKTVSSSSTTASGSGGCRKHPTVITSSFCSSKKFRLQPFQVLASIREAGRSSNAALLKPKLHQPLSRDGINRINFAEALKEKLSNSGRSNLARTLKDHLYQCPCRISEEMVRCMASMYYLIRSDSPEKPSKLSRAPFLQRSSTTSFSNNSNSSSSNLHRDHHHTEREWLAKTSPAPAAGVEVPSIKLDKRCPRASYTISNYRFLVEQLERVDVGAMESSFKLAFWINVYNSLVMHAYLVYGVPSSSLKRIALFNKAAYNIGGQVITANCIEYSIIGCRTSRMGRWFETILSTAMRKKSGGEDKQLILSKMGLPTCHPLVFFAICTGASSDPMLRVYSGKNVIEELETAKREFLQSQVMVKKSSRIFVPKLVERYAKENSMSSESLLAWLRDNASKKQQEAIRRCVGSSINGAAATTPSSSGGGGGRMRKMKASQVIEWLPYDTRFRYVLSRDLVLEINNISSSSSNNNNSHNLSPPPPPPLAPVAASASWM